MNFSGGGKYGLQLRTPVSSKKPTRSAPALSFLNDDDDDGVEDEIARQASKKKSLKDVEQQHKKALEEDPSVFDYDGVYDKMKSATSHPSEQGTVKREPKYIGKLIQKAQLRKQEQEIIYERQLTKERSKEDHLYADKEKFVTAAYKNKLAEQAKWLEEERLRELREEANDVTKKDDMSDFYRNLLKKNVAFGANSSKKDPVLPCKEQAEFEAEAQPSKDHSDKASDIINRKPSGLMPRNTSDEPEPWSQPSKSVEDVDRDTVEKPSSSTTSASKADSGLHTFKEATTSNIGDKAETTSEQVNSSSHDHRPSQEVLAAAKERYLARKRMRVG